jgi:hypothetical protein
MQHVAEQRKSLTKEAASDLLKQHGYALTTPFGHVHATDGTRELHICRLDELHSMGTTQFLDLFSEALAWLAKLDEASGFYERSSLFANTLPASGQVQTTSL